MGANMKPREIAGALNARLERLMPLVTPSGVALGFLFPGVFIILRPFIAWFFALMTLSGALKLRARELGAALRSPLPILIYFLSAHAAMPLIVLFFSRLVFRGDTDTVAGYVLLFSSPTAVSGFIWVSIFRGDPTLALALILLDTLAAPLVMPGTVSLLLGTTVSLDMTGMALSLLVMVVLPTVVGVAANETSGGKVPALLSPYLNPLSKICLALVISANAAAVAPQVRLDNPRVWLIAALCVCFSSLSFFSAKLTGILARLTPEKRVSLLFTAGLRNTVAATTIAIEYFPAAAAQPAILGIMFQQVMAALMGKLLLRRGRPGLRAN
jgi:predicted Na+-dependent transporter